MNTLSIPSRSLDIEVPSHWDEMRPDQVSYCLEQILRAGAGLISVAQAKVRCFYKLADIRRDWRTIAWERMMYSSAVTRQTPS